MASVQHVQSSNDGIKAPSLSKFTQSATQNFTGLATWADTTSIEMSNEKEADSSILKRSVRPSANKQLCLKEDIQLRKYQMELAAPGLQGKNYILVAPTGIGKTLIAGYIIMNHLKQMKDKGKNGKVAFVTPTRQLTFQQKEQLQQYIPDIMAVDITGACGHQMQPLIQNELVDVIVCTAGKLRQELKTEGVHISDFSLIIADECHHAGRPSNYTDVMEFYIREKHTPTSSNCLPQVVGMTASPGAGKGKATLLTVKEHQISLCAKLDSTAGIVTVKRNIKELEMFQNDPKSHYIVADERNPNEPFIESMHSAMQQLEKLIDNVPCLTKGSPEYESWLKNEKEAAENREQDETARISILDQLFVYSQSLMTYNDFRYEDAVTVLDDIEELPHQSQLEKTLIAVHRCLLESLSLAPKIPNPLLVHTESALLDQYSRFPQSKGIFFVRTVKQTRYVINWIKSSPDLSRIIRVARITGFHHHGGMEKAEQLRVLEAFRNGTYNLLASTSVLEEGLDVPECNYVVRYQNISNEIAQVQAKGRARADNSRIYTVVSANSKMGYWYIVQEQKRHLVNEMIVILQQSDIEPNFSQIQKSFILERDRKAELIKKLRSKWPDAEQVEIRCKKCNVLACKGSDVFMYTLSRADPGYIVPSETFGEKYEKRDHDKPEISDYFIKPYRIFCRSPSCRTKWGVVGLWRDTEYKFPLLKCEQFLFKYGHVTKTFRKWKNIWFDIKSIQDWVEDDVNT